jgi:hypothetical protein
MKGEVMKSCFTALLVITLLTGSIVAGERVERFIESDLPIIIDGNWIYPENGGYTIVMTDSFLTVNGFEYVHPEDRSAYKYEPPSKEKSFLDWIIRTTLEQAHQIVDSGGSPEEAREYMDSVFTYYADGDTFGVSSDEYGNFELFHSNSRSSIIVPVPQHPRRNEPAPTYRQRVVEIRFNELCNYMERGYLILRGTKTKYFNSSFRAFRPEDVSLIMKELKAVTKKAVKTTEGGKSRYRPMLIAGRYNLTPSEVEILVNPERLKRR